MAPKTAPSAPTPIYKTSQFYWFLGHAVALVYSFLYTVVGYFSPARSLTYYKYALVAIIFTYLVVIKQSHAARQLGSLMRDENVVYCTYAVILLLNAQLTLVAVSSSLVSYSIFLVFHCVGYFQRHVLPLVPVSIVQQSQINNVLNNFTTQFNQPALFMASSMELMSAVSQIFTLVWLLSRPFAFLINLAVLAASVMFLKLRYDASAYTRATMQQFDGRARELTSRVGLDTLYSNIIVRVVALVKAAEPKPKTK